MPPIPTATSEPATASRAWWVREFWRGLTTPDFGVIPGALALLVVILVVVSALALRFKEKVDRGEAAYTAMSEEYIRLSLRATRGAARETAGAENSLVFFGPSALRCWIPKEDEATRIATEVTGTPTKVLTLCGNGQSYALTAALVDRFGADFNGWIVIGVDRQSIGRNLTGRDLMLRLQQGRTFGFESEIFRSEAAYLGYRQPEPTGWELWDRRSFYFQSRLGVDALFRNRQPYEPHFPPKGSIDLELARPEIRPLSEELLDRRLAVLERIVSRARSKGPARIALLETPWLDNYLAAIRPPDWAEDEARYEEKMTSWCREHRVPRLTGAEKFHAVEADFTDPWHIGSGKLREQFIAMVSRELNSVKLP